MDEKGADQDARLEVLRARLVDLESRQRATGGTVEPDFFAPEPACTSGSADTVTSSCAAGPVSGEGDRAGSGGPLPLPLGLGWDEWVRVAGRLAPTFAFAAGITLLPRLGYQRAG